MNIIELIDAKNKELETKFDKINAEKNSLHEELFRLQGAFRSLAELKEALTKETVETTTDTESAAVTNKKGE